MSLAWILVGLLAMGFGTVMALWFRRPRSDSQPFLLLQEQLNNLREDLGDQTQGFQRLIDENLHKNLKLMQESQHQVGNRLDNAARVIGEVQSRLGKMEEANQRIFEVGKDIASLQEILRAPKLRGALGELFLGDLLAQIMPAEHFTIQHRFSNGEMVDAVVRLGEYLVPIDAKFPFENFRRFAATENEQEKKEARRLFKTDVKKHVDAIATKYIRPDEQTFDFALMYIPAENIYYETIIKDDSLDGDKGLAHYALRKRVVPVSPNNFYAYLNTILLGLRGFKIEKSIHEIIANLSRLKGDFGRFAQDFAKLGTHLNHARGSFETAERRLQRFEDKLHTLELPEPETETPRLSAVPSPSND